MDERDSARSRRDFLRGAGTLAAAGLAGCAPEAKTTATAESPALLAAKGDVQSRTLGRTGLKVSVVGAGTTNLAGGAQVLRRAFTSGINYVDTSMCYMGGRSEEIVGQAVKGIRDQVVIATKWDVGPNHTKAQIMAMLEASLRKLGTDRIDLMLIHQLGDHNVPGGRDTGFNRLENEALYEAMTQAKKDGKIRFTGASSHVGNRRQILERAIGTGAFDVILVSYNYSNFQGSGVPELLQLCRQKNIGVVGMKTQQGNVKVQELAGRETSLFQANLKWCLAQGAHTVVNTQIGASVEKQDEALQVARGDLRLARAEEELLADYVRYAGTEYCRGCSQHCQSACPAGIEIATVLRYRMYHQYYGQTRQAADQYRLLPAEQRLSLLCGECNLCQQSCPHGLPVVEHLFQAQRLMRA